MTDIRKALETLQMETEAAIERAKGSIPEALEEADRLEAEGRLKEAQDVYMDIYTLGIFEHNISGIKDERTEYAGRRSLEIGAVLHRRMMAMIDSNPYGRLVIGSDGIEGVCCKEFRDAVNDGEMFIRAHQGLHLMVNEAYRRYARAEIENGMAGNDYEYYEATECPFCGRDFTEEIHKAEREYTGCD